MDAGEISARAAGFWASPASSRAMNCRPLEACNLSEVQVGDLLVRLAPEHTSCPG